MTTAPAIVTQSFTTRAAPWYQVGRRIETDVDSSEAATLGGLDFDVELRPAAFGSAGQWKSVDSRRAAVRVDTDQFFSFVSADYEVVQYRDAFNFMDGVNPRYVAAGQLNGGRQGFMVAQLPEANAELRDLLDGRDPHELFVVLRTSHDLSKAVEVALVPLREKCMNQLALPSLTSGAPQRWSIRHVGDAHAKLRQAQDVLSNANRYAGKFAEQVTKLAATPVSLERADIILKRVLPDRPKRDEQVKSILAAWRGSEFVGADYVDSAWGLVNGVSEYFEWQRDTGRRTDQSRFTSGLAGDVRKYVSRTAQLALVG